MGKHIQLNQSHVYKINSTRIMNAKYNLELPLEQANKNKELVKLNSSQTLRFIERWENRSLKRPYDYNRDVEIHRVKKELTGLNKLNTNKDIKRKVKEQHCKLNNLLYNPHYVMVIMDNKTDLDKLCSPKRFKINGHEYRRFVATTGGGKKSTVVFVSDNVFNYLDIHINMGRNLEMKMNPAKLEAYKALACSASTPVSNPKGVLIVDDAFTTFKSNVLTIDDRSSEYPVIEKVEGYTVEDMCASDGYGLVLPWQAHEWGNELGYDHPIIGVYRNGFTKGALFPFDFIEFANTVARNYEVVDAWGIQRDIRDYSVILPKSMMKLWESYDSLESVQDAWDRYGYTFAVTKVVHTELDNVGDLNYQFIQSLKLTDDEIEELIKPTVNEIKDVLGLDHRKTLLYLRGTKLSERNVLRNEPDFTQALMIDKRMINDPFVRKHVYKMINRRISDAKTGVLRVNGNFSILSGDPYLFCQSIFGIPLTGLLKAGEYYSKYWIDRGVDKVAAFRAPMTNHNNIRIFRFIRNDEIDKWYEHMKTVTIFNSWDTTTHALNGNDFDGDAAFTTNNSVIMDNIKELDAIICMQGDSGKTIPTESDLITANKASFGDAIGTTTNRITSMFDVLANYDEGSEQYLEVNYRIMSGQMIQQNVIDKTKGIKAKPMPKHWYEPKISYSPIAVDLKGKPIKDENGRFIPLPESEEDKERREFNLEIVANKRPYFFIYKKGSSELGKYKKYIETIKRSCIMQFGIKIEDLISKETKSEEEQKFIDQYHKNMPVSVSASTMNRICWKVEDSFQNVKEDTNCLNFDSSIMKTDKKYSQARFKEIKLLYKEHNLEMQNYMKQSKELETDEDKEEESEIRKMFVERFRQAAMEICSNEEDICNIVVDLCYKKGNKSQQFAWDVSGNQIIRNLLRINNMTYCYPVKDDEGEIEYSGHKFNMIEKKMEDESY